MKFVLLPVLFFLCTTSFCGVRDKPLKESTVRLMSASGLSSKIVEFCHVTATNFKKAIYEREDISLDKKLRVTSDEGYRDACKGIFDEVYKSLTALDNQTVDRLVAWYESNDGKGHRINIWSAVTSARTDAIFSDDPNLLEEMFAHKDHVLVLTLMNVAQVPRVLTHLKLRSDYTVDRLAYLALDETGTPYQYDDLLGFVSSRNLKHLEGLFRAVSILSVLDNGHITRDNYEAFKSFYTSKEHKMFVDFFLMGFDRGIDIAHTRWERGIAKALWSESL